MSNFKPSFRRPYSPMRVRPSPQAVGLEEENVAVGEPDQPVPIDTPKSRTRAGAALTLTTVFLFFRISFLHEFIAAKLHFDLHILMLLGALSLLAAFLKGKLLIAIRSRISVYWILFALWLFVATITSSWQGGSLPILLDYLRTTLPLLFLIPAVSDNTEDLLKIVRTIGWAGIATIGIGFSTKEYSQGRLLLKDAPSIGNSNDYAAYLVYVFPFVVYLLFGPRAKTLHKLAGLVVVPLGLYQILGTGSRGGVVGVAATLAAVLILAKPKVKLAILVGLPVLAMIALPLISSKSLDRLKSVFVSSQRETNGRNEAEESRQARTKLLEASIKLTFAHPLFGVGPKQFEESEYNDAKAEQRRGMWHETHNTFTQVSSECGIPALLFFMTALISAFATLWKLKSSSDYTLAGIARIVLISMFGFLVCILFLSHAYDFPVIISCSLVVTIANLLPKSRADRGFAS
jgi:O-antigen ligase